MRNLEQNLEVLEQNFMEETCQKRHVDGTFSKDPKISEYTH